MNHRLTVFGFISVFFFASRIVFIFAIHFVQVLMQLKKIQDYFQRYHRHLKTLREHPASLHWESLWHFQRNWDEEAEDFAAMYDRSLENSQSRRLWKGHNYFPKEMMLKLIQVQPDYAWAMFRDLFDESKAIDGRIGRFKAGCDELLRIYKAKYPRSVENNHFHEDNRMISLYLSFRYPMQYCPFDYPSFQRTMEKLGTTNIPASFEIERFFKTSRTLYNFAIKEEGLLEAQRQLLPVDHSYEGESLLLMLDFYHFCD